MASGNVISHIIKIRLVGLQSVRVGFWRRAITYTTDDYFIGEVAFDILLEVDDDGWGHQYITIVTQDGRNYWRTAVLETSHCFRRIIATPHDWHIGDDKRIIEKACKEYGETIIK